MVDIVEQAKQRPRNATPLGFDAAMVRYPGVNTCATVTIAGRTGLVGLHLGLFMGAGEEGGKGSEDSRMIDGALLKLYFSVLERSAYLRAAGTMTTRLGGGSVQRTRRLQKIYVAGALDVWRTSAIGQWSTLTQLVKSFADDSGARLEAYQFDDGEEGAATVDIQVASGGVTFLKSESATVVRGIRRSL